MKALVAAFNQGKALVGAFSVITNLWMELFEALQDTLLRAAQQTQHKLLHYMDVVMLCAERCTVPCSATDLVSLFALITTILSSARQPAPEMRYHLHKYHPHNR